MDAREGRRTRYEDSQQYYIIERLLIIDIFHKILDIPHKRPETSHKIFDISHKTLEFSDT